MNASCVCAGRSLRPWWWKRQRNSADQTQRRRDRGCWGIRTRRVAQLLSVASDNECAMLCVFHLANRRVCVSHTSIILLVCGWFSFPFLKEVKRCTAAPGRVHTRVRTCSSSYRRLATRGMVETIRAQRQRLGHVSHLSWDVAAERMGGVRKEE